MRVGRIGGSCWRCGYVFDAVTAAYGDDDRLPTAGAVSICIDCGAVGLYADGPTGLVVRQPTDAEHADLLDDPAVVRALVAWMAMQDRHGGKS
jgi:hypothetical protein